MLEKISRNETKRDRAVSPKMKPLKVKSFFCMVEWYRPFFGTDELLSPTKQYYITWNANLNNIS